MQHSEELEMNDTERPAPLAAQPDEDVDALASQAQARIDAASAGLEKAQAEALNAQQKFDSAPSAASHSAAAVAAQKAVIAQAVLNAAREAAAPAFTAQRRQRMTRETLELVAELQNDPTQAVIAKLTEAVGAWRAALDQLSTLPAALNERTSKVKLLEARRRQLPELDGLPWFVAPEPAFEMQKINAALAPFGTSVRGGGSNVVAETRVTK